MAPKRLTTHLPVAPGMCLREMRAADASALFALTAANRAHLKRWLPWLDGVRTAADSRKFIRQSQQRRVRGEALTFGVFVGSQLAGVVEAHALDWENRQTTLGYWLGKEFEGQGLMTRACARLIAYLLAELGFHRIGIHCAVQNWKSRAIPERLGFRQEGVLRQSEWLYDHFVDHVVYARLAGAWQGGSRREARADSKRPVGEAQESALKTRGGMGREARTSRLSRHERLRTTAASTGTELREC